MYDLKYIYDLIYKDIVTPFNLLENAKLPNYEYVKYYNKKNFFIAEMKCEVSRNDVRKFYYCFNKDNQLEYIYQKINQLPTQLLFDRQEELRKIKTKVSTENKKQAVVNQ